MNQIDRLLGIMQYLRGPENGCPWNKEQTFSTIAPYTLGGTYKVLGAIAREGFDNLHGELDDLPSQVMFYTQMVQEGGRSNFDDIRAAISDKLECHHPHVFADVPASNDTEVLTRWKKIKSEERAQKAQHSALDDIPRSLPALIRAQRIQRRCSNAGFDWKTSRPAVDKVYGEIDEIMLETKQAIVGQAKLEEEMGDLLFATVSMARHLGTKAEIALQRANEKLERHFREVKRIMASCGLEMTGVDPETTGEV